ncbi:hypothetical protein [Bradyrhizobium australiense]|uniref:hypothetical protein n=1 Tax=Bradyrhizobium australiense TaxID=2721161 RepID=UPI0035D5D05B
MHGLEKSDPVLLATKLTNKAGLPAAEAVERRTGAEGNANQLSTRRAQDWESVSQALERVRQAARQRKKERFTELYHHLSLPALRTAFFALKREAAPGVDGVTWRDYEADLDRKLADLHARSIGERTGRNQAAVGIFRRRMADSARSQWLPWKTRSSNAQLLPC